MRSRFLLASMWILGAGLLAAQRPTTSDQTRWKAEAARVTIVRDDWGIAHVHGKSDADAVFGMIYAQCEDDCNRVETDPLSSPRAARLRPGRERHFWQDLRHRGCSSIRRISNDDYTASPEWLQAPDGCLGGRD